MTREDIMREFRTHEHSAFDDLSNDDRCEIFLNILAGSSDLTRELIEELHANYS